MGLGQNCARLDFISNHFFNSLLGLERYFIVWPPSFVHDSLSFCAANCGGIGDGFEFIAHYFIDNRKLDHFLFASFHFSDVLEDSHHSLFKHLLIVLQHLLIVSQHLLI